MSQRAAFFRVEGTLVPHGALRCAAYLAANAQGFAERALRLAEVALAAPLAFALSQNDRVAANRAAYLACRGLSADRLAVLCDEYFETQVRPRVLARGVELVEAARTAGLRVVLVTEALEPVARRLVEVTGPIDHLWANRLEMRSDRATGTLLDPMVGGFDTGRWAKDLAAGGGWDLTQSRAYAACGPDLVLLDVVGEPCAVNPDYTLRRAARQADWPVVYYDA